MAHIVRYSRDVRFRPLIPMRFRGPLSGKEFGPCEALADTGAYRTTLPLDIAVALDLDLEMRFDSQGREKKLGWRGGEHELWFGIVEVEVVDHGGRRLLWSADAGFTTAPIDFPLFGQREGLDYFDSTFRSERRQLELEPLAHFYAASGRILGPP